MCFPKNIFLCVSNKANFETNQAKIGHSFRGKLTHAIQQSNEMCNLEGWLYFGVLEVEEGWEAMGCGGSGTPRRLMLKKVVKSG